MSRTPQNVFNDASTLSLAQARLCLFRLRWSVLLLVCEGPLEMDQNLDLTRFNEVYFSEEPKDMWELFDQPELLQWPKGLLLLLNSWQYNVLDAIEPYSHRGNWATDTMSCLVPLHDGACCRRRDGPSEHVAACAILTFIAHVLHACESDRDELLQDHLWEYGLLWDNPGFRPLDEWTHGFAMSEGDCHRPPSHEFLMVLHDAGLDKWLETDDDFDYLPPSHTSHRRLLEYDDGMFTKALRKLRQSVDINRDHSGPSRSNQRWIQTPGSLPPAAPTEEQTLISDVTSASRNASSSACLDDISSSRRVDTFDLETVIVDHAVGVASSQPYGHEAAIGACCQARISASLDGNAHNAHEIEGELPAKLPLSMDVDHQNSVQARTRELPHEPVGDRTIQGVADQVRAVGVDIGQTRSQSTSESAQQVVWVVG
ncbi:hypothetical protein PENSPDRAFT_663664 [Peniophora sp. CONT]|nr:hypothetical protein PENSPDRAFT_663664 [Peniophora sp. CONT]